MASRLLGQNASGYAQGSICVEPYAFGFCEDGGLDFGGLKTGAACLVRGAGDGASLLA